MSKSHLSRLQLDNIHGTFYRCIGELTSRQLVSHKLRFSFKTPQICGDDTPRKGFTSFLIFSILLVCLVLIPSGLFYFYSVKSWTREIIGFNSLIYVVADKFRVRVIIYLVTIKYTGCVALDLNKVKPIHISKGLIIPFIW